jgi:small GTP-binding protein
MSSCRGCKVVLFGSINVGKTALLSRIRDDRFDSQTEPTTCAGYAVYRSPLDDSVAIQFWDTAGMERYHSINRMYYHDAVGAILTFDLTKRKSFDDCDDWLDEFQKFNTVMDPLIILAGNKCDLEHEVTEEEARAWAAAHSIQYFAVSARSGEGVSELLDGLVNALPKQDDAPNLKQSTDPARCCRHT